MPAQSLEHAGLRKFLWSRGKPQSGFVPILLQKSQIARRQFSCCKKIRPTTADRCGPNHVAEVASEFIFRQ
jgi:hypothetical protein